MQGSYPSQHSGTVHTDLMSYLMLLARIAGSFRLGVQSYSKLARGNPTCEMQDNWANDGICELAPCFADPCCGVGPAETLHAEDRYTQT